MDTVELFMEIETAFGVHIADSKATNTGVSRDRLAPSARFVKDLGLD